MARRLVAAVLVLAGCGARTGLGDGEPSAAFDASAHDASVDVREAGPLDARSDQACVPQKVTLTLPSTAPWTATGLQILAGARVMMTVTGTVRYGGGAAQVTDANGGNFDGQKFFPTAVLPNAIVVALIGKVGGTIAVDTGAPVPEGAPGAGSGFVGTTYDRTIPTSGPLFLGFNDQRPNFSDNVGAFTVTITIEC